MYCVQALELYILYKNIFKDSTGIGDLLESELSRRIIIWDNIKVL